MTVRRIIITFIFLLTSEAAYAGAWVQDVGKGLFIQSASYYSASRYFDNSGNKQSQSSYHKYELNPYLEYGVSYRLTLGANIFLSRTSQYDTNTASNRTNYGIGDSEFFARSLIYKKDGFVFSAEPMVKLPSLDKSSDQPQIGSRHFDAGMGFSGGYGFKAFGLNHFIDIDAAYRHRFGAPHDQLRFTATAGVAATQNIVISGQVFNTVRLDKSANPAFTESSADDYDLTKLQISAAYKIDPTLSFQLGAFSDIAGKNVGKGNGTTLSISKEF